IEEQRLAGTAGSAGRAAPGRPASGRGGRAVVAGGAGEARARRLGVLGQWAERGAHGASSTRVKHAGPLGAGSNRPGKQVRKAGRLEQSPWRCSPSSSSMAGGG